MPLAKQAPTLPELLKYRAGIAAGKQDIQKSMQLVRDESGRVHLAERLPPEQIKELVQKTAAATEVDANSVFDNCFPLAPKQEVEKSLGTADGVNNDLNSIFNPLFKPVLAGGHFRTETHEPESWLLQTLADEMDFVLNGIEKPGST